MKRAIPILIVLLFCLSFVPRSASAGEENGDKVELRLRFTDGQQLTLTKTVEQNTTRTWNDEERESKKTTSMTMALDVFSVDDDGTAYMKVTIESIALKRRDGGRWSYDSANAPDLDEVPPPAVPFAAMVGEAFMMYLTADGEVTEFEGVGKMLMVVTGKLDNADRAWGAAEELARHFAEEALKRTFEGIFGFVPDEPVAVGDSWTRTINTDHGIPVAAEEKYTLTERSEGTATIELEAKLKPQERPEDEGDDAATGRGRGTVWYDVTGTQKGTLTVDEATGCLFKTAVTRELEGKMVTSGFRGGDTERSMPVKSKTAITVETHQQEQEAEAEDAPEPE